MVRGQSEQVSEHVHITLKCELRVTVTLCDHTYLLSHLQMLCLYCKMYIYTDSLNIILKFIAYYLHIIIIIAIFAVLIQNSTLSLLTSFV